MSNEYSYPGVYVEEVPIVVRPIEGVSTSCAFVGRTARGPLDDSRPLGSFQEFVERYGGLDPRNRLGHSVMHFFANGGRSARIAALSADGGDPLGPEEIDAALERLDAVDDFQLLAVPGQSSPGLVARFQSYCLRRRAFYLVDCDEQASFATLGNGPDPAITGPSAINSALYFPWVIAPDPLQENRLRPDPPSGFVAGIYARTDALRGVWKAPAGADAILTRSAGVSRPLTDLESGALNERGVNCLRTFPLRAGALIWGSRTLDGSEERDSEWKYVPVRRLALFLEESLVRWHPVGRLRAQHRVDVGARPASRRGPS